MGPRPGQGRRGWGQGKLGGLLRASEPPQPSIERSLWRALEWNVCQSCPGKHHLIASGHKELGRASNMQTRSGETVNN